MAKNKKNIYRPLLAYSRTEIELYNRSNGVDFVTDSSNLENKYTRNRIRREVLPKFKEAYPNIVDSLCLFAERCSRDDSFIEGLVPYKLLSVNKDSATINIEIVNLHYALSSRLIKKAFEEINVFADIEEKHIKEVLALCKKQTGKQICLTNGLKALKEYDSVIIFRERELEESQIHKFELSDINFEGFGLIKVEKYKESKLNFEKNTFYLDLDKVGEGVVWRTMEDGDVFAKFGSGRKKLADFYIDKKIPQRERRLLPILADGKNILFVAGLDISENVKITGETKNIIKIKCIKK